MQQFLPYKDYLNNRQLFGFFVWKSFNWIILFVFWEKGGLFILDDLLHVLILDQSMIFLNLAREERMSRVVILQIIWLLDSFGNNDLSVVLKVLFLFQAFLLRRRLVFGVSAGFLLVGPYGKVLAGFRLETHGFQWLQGHKHFLGLRFGNVFM